MDELQNEIDNWRDAHWDEVMADLEALVEVESVEDLGAAREGAPFGPGPREALDRALAIAGRCGLEAHDCDGYVGFADLPGASEVQLGIIGHVDVVPAGPGWTVDPFAVTRRDGYLLGRGVIDDKGPLLVALHAVRFWAERCAARGERLPYTVRVIFGANEETDMKDIEHYRERFADPAFLFTPDSQFPLGYGESGICSGTLVSAPVFGEAAGGDILEIGGGQAVNAVPGEAWAVVRDEAAPGGTRRIEARGVSAHAIDCDQGVNAIALLIGQLLDEGVGTQEERQFLAFQKALLDDTSGARAEIATCDEHFGALSMIGGMVSMEDGCVRQTIDVRYPTKITAERIERRLNKAAFESTIGAYFEMEHDKEPFLMDPDSPAVQALLDAYRSVTGDDAEGLTSKGGTYARCFKTGVSFGAEKSWVASPDWVGGMHGPDEGMSEELLKEAFSIYARAIGNLMLVDFS